MEESTLTADYLTAARALRVKRRALSEELSTYLLVIKKDSLPATDAFNVKKAYFEELWQEVMKQCENCKSLLQDGGDAEQQELTWVGDTIEDLLAKKERLGYIEEDIISRDTSTGDVKNVEGNILARTAYDKAASSSGTLESDAPVEPNSKVVDANIDEVESIGETASKVVNFEVASPAVSKIMKQEINLDTASDFNESLNGSIIDHLKDVMSENNTRLSNNMYAMNDNINAMGNHMRDMNESINQSLDRCMERLSSGMTTLQGNVNDIRSNVIELNAENVEIRSDIEKKKCASPKVK